MKTIILNKKVVSDVKYKIVKVKQLQDSVIIYLDNKEKIYLSIESYFNYSISSQKGLDDDLYLKLKQEERLFLAYRGTLRKLSAKDFTIKQIKDYLIIKKELNHNEANIVINRLIEYGLLDDDKYCQNRVTYLNKQLLSTKQIVIKLKKEGLSLELIEKYVINNIEDEYLKADKLAKKYSTTIKNKSENAIKQNILSKIVNAGYSYDVAKDVVDSLKLEVDNEDELLKKEYIKAYNKYSKKYDDYNLKNHIYAYLLNKGFKTDSIRNIMEENYGKTS